VNGLRLCYSDKEYSETTTKMMKRKIAALFLPLLLIGGALFISWPHTFLNSQVAHASDGCPDNHEPPCVTLVVKLNPAPASNATVVATRQGPIAGKIEKITLKATSAGSYTSGGPIDFSNDLGTCSGGQVSKANLFNITVSGSATGSLSNLNICYNASPKADRNGIKTTTVHVSTASNPGTQGGISGTLKIQVPTGDVIACQSAGVTLNGKYYKDVTVSSTGDFNTGLILDAGTYELTAECPFQNNPYHFSAKNIQVVAGKITAMGAQTSVGTTSVSGSDPEAKQACANYVDGSDSQNACIAGYNGGKAGKKQPDTCDDYGPSGTKHNHSQALHDACVAGFAAGDPTSGGDDTAQCIANSHTSLEWIMCPVITALSKATEGLNGFIENQLRFDVGNFLPDSGGNAGAHKAWTVLKDLSTTILIIVLLIMVFSQAAGGGLFEAYTIRKILPRLVVAVIAMQLSWELCKFAIGLMNSLGDGLAELMAAPFGGTGNLDLGSLLNHLGSGGAAVVSTASLGAIVVSALFLGPILAPGAGLVLFSVFMTVLIGLASILFRNIIIITCVIFSPVAFLLWTIPNQSMKKYWNLWSDNFIKALMLFPIMVGIIYAGRLFAYIAGGAAGGGSNIGFLNIIMILVGFFAPYAILPKAFKWGGSLMSSGANMIANNAAVKKGGEFGKKEIREAIQRKQGEAAKAYNPDAPMLGVKRKFGVIPVPTGRMASRIKSGSFMPTERGRRMTIQKGDKWSGEQDEMAQAYLKRAGEKAMADPNGYEKVIRDTSGRALSASRIRIDRAGNMFDARGKKTMKIDEAREIAMPGEAVAIEKLTGVGAMKQRWVDMLDDPEADANVKKMAIRQLIDTSSWPEIQGAYTSGGRRVFESEEWVSSVTTSPDHYPKVLRSRVDAAPHVEVSAYEQGEKAGYTRKDNSVEARQFRSSKRIDYALEKQMSNEDFATQSDGFWQEVSAMANSNIVNGVTGTTEMVDWNGTLVTQQEHIRRALDKRFAAIKAAGPTVRQQMLGHLKDGGALEKAINEALPSGKKIDDYLV
jgi:hypothetical protein